MLKSASVAARVCAAGAAEPPAEEPPAALPEASVAVDVAAPAEVLLLPPPLLLLLVPLLVLELPPLQAVRTTAAVARTRAAAPRAGRRRAGGVLVRWDTRAPTRPTVDRPGGRTSERSDTATLHYLHGSPSSAAVNRVLHRRDRERVDTSAPRPPARPGSPARALPCAAREACLGQAALWLREACG